MLAQRGGQHIVGSLNWGIKDPCGTGRAPGGYRAWKNGGVVPPNRVATCSGANCERGPSLLPSLRTRRCVLLMTRLDWQGGLFQASTSALLGGGEREGSGELSEKSSSSVL